MRQPRHRLVLLLTVIPLSAILFACGASSTVSTIAKTPTATSTPVPSASVTRVTNPQHFADSKSGGSTAPCANGDPLINGDCGVTITATCAAGDVIVSGGYQVDDPLAFVTSSFPSSATTWTVTAHDEGQDGASHPVTVTAYADCLHANFAAGMSIIPSTPTTPNDSNPHEATVTCPTGSVVTGGGFRGTNSMNETIPTTNGWTAALAVQVGASATPSLYAVCASKHITAASQPKTTQDPFVGTGTSATVACPSGSLLVGGGGSAIGYGNMTSLAANGTLTQWLLQVKTLGVVGGPASTYSVADYAVCATIS